MTSTAVKVLKAQREQFNAGENSTGRTLVIEGDSEKTITTLKAVSNKVKVVLHL